MTHATITAVLRLLPEDFERLSGLIGLQRRV